MSGSGKTTLLNLVGGIEPPSGGQVVVLGRDITALDEDERTTFRRVPAARYDVGRGAKVMAQLPRASARASLLTPVSVSR